MIKCFFMEPTGKEYRFLRRYNGDIKCSMSGTGYHNEQSFLDLVEINDEYDWTHNDEHWPKKCKCGYEFKEEDEWQLFKVNQYCRQDNSSIVYSLRNESEMFGAPPGAMWYADWMPWKGDDGHTLVVRTPDGFDWDIDSKSSNCTLPNDSVHKCWVRHGVPPNITVDKNGNTCKAGGGSIQTPKWHGFLRNGELKET